jgi:hypothetical protein
MERKEAGGENWQEKRCSVVSAGGVKEQPQ